MVETAVAQTSAVDETRLRRVLIAVILTQLLIVIDFFALNLARPPMAIM